MNKPKFNKKKCLKCKYHSKHPIGWPVRVKQKDGTYKTVNVSCNYNFSGEVALKRDASNKNGYKDSRGDDYNNCLLFKEGPQLKED